MALKKIGLKFLIALLILLMAAPTAFAEEQVKMIFNGKEFQAGITLKDGVTYITAEALAKIPGLVVGDQPTVAVRKLFESQGGKVHWDKDNKRVIVSWREKVGDYTADELVIKYSELLKEVNTYRMKGSSLIEYKIEGNQDLMGIPNLPKMEAFIEGVFQDDPKAMYMKQTMKMPLDELGPSPEELEAAGLGDDMVTEIVWSGNVIYQKAPTFDQWIYQDLTGMEEMLDLNNLMQMTPQQSIEMMNKAGVINVFGEDVVKEGKEYYTIKNRIDSESYKKLTQEVLKNMDLASFISAFAVPSDLQGTEDIGISFEKIFDIILNNMEIEYDIDTLINKESLLPDYMNIDLTMTIDFRQLFDAMAGMTKVDEAEKSEIPEGPMKIQLKMKGEYQLYDYGTELELPDLSNAISQEEYMQQLMGDMEATE